MYDVPVIGFAGWSGVGKTALLRRLIPALGALGLRVAVLKHDVHGLDLEGKDSRQLFRAGAETVLTCGGGELLLAERRSRSFGELLALVGDADLVLAEGFKEEPIPQIGLCRGEIPLPAPPARYEAVVTDRTDPETEVPTFSFDETEALARFLAERRQSFRAPKF